MHCLIQKLFFIKPMSILFIMLFASCSEREAYKKKDDRKEFYLKTTPLIPLRNPDGIILQNQSNDYSIPNITNTNGAIGKELDIRPPVQPLALISGTYAQFTEDTATLLIYNEHKDTHTLWKKIISILISKNFSINEYNHSNHILTTDWIKWDREDENCLYYCKYRVSVQQKENHHAVIIVNLLNFEQGNQSIISSLSKQRYSMEFLNEISTGLYKHSYLAKNENIRIK